MKKRYITLSIHDVTPKFKDEIKKIVSSFDDEGFKIRSLGIVPNYGLEHELTKDEDFSGFLLDQADKGNELIYHGYSHFSDRRKYRSFFQWFKGEVFAQGEAEFQNLTYDETKERLSKGKEIFDRLGIKPSGFIPPCWMTSPGGRKAIKEYGFEYLVKSGHIEDLKRGREIKSKVFFFASHTPFMSYLSRGYDKYLEKIHLVNKQLATIPIHPRNIHEGESFRSCIETVHRLISSGRELISYNDFLNKKDEEYNHE